MNKNYTEYKKRLKKLSRTNGLNERLDAARYRTDSL